MDTHWTLVDATSVAPQAAFNTYRHGAAQPVSSKPSDHVAECVGIRVVSFNFGMPQSMLESARQWNNRHIFKFRDVLSSLGHAAGNDFVFCSEVGDARKGLQAANLDCRNIVADALPGAAYSNSGAYLHVWNVRHQAAVVVASGTWSAPTGHTTDMHWQAFDLNYRDASQLAGRVGVLVGNMHIPCGSHPPTMNTRKKIVGQALDHLSHLDVEAWRGRDNFPVLRILVGDCNLGKDLARSCTQDFRPPPLTPLQTQFELGNWQVCDVLFPRQALDSARTQNTQMFGVAIVVWSSLVFWP